MRIETIKRDVDRKMSAAMKQIKTVGDEIITRSFDEYYDAASPEVYIRTDQSRSGAYPGVIAGANMSYTMRIGYEPSQIPGYSSGMHPSGAVVFEWMVNGAMGVVGWGGFVQSALDQIQSLIPSVFGQYFY